MRIEDVELIQNLRHRPSTELADAERLLLVYWQANCRISETLVSASKGLIEADDALRHIREVLQET